MDIGTLTLEQKIGQLVWASHSSPDCMEMLEQGKLGGFYVGADSVPAAVEQFNRWQRISPIPMLFSADFEMGVGSVLKEGGTHHPSPMALGATDSEELAYQAGMINALETRAIGSHWNHGPVVDVNTNPDNPIIG